MGSVESRHQAARCLQLAENAPAAKLRDFFIAEMQAWNRLAEDQEWLEQRAAERQSRAAIAQFPTLHALLSAASSASRDDPRRRSKKAAHQGHAQSQGLTPGVSSGMPRARHMR
jgi:hypothetical protein